jgi:hypothetical protein
MKLGIYITAREPISTAYLKNHSHQSVCLYVYPLSLLGNGSVNTFPRFMNTRKNRTVRRVVSYVVRVVSKESRRLVLPGTSSFLHIV